MRKQDIKGHFFKATVLEDKQKDAAVPRKLARGKEALLKKKKKIHTSQKTHTTGNVSETYVLVKIIFSM